MQGQQTVIVLGAGQGSRFSPTRHKLAESLGDSSVLAATLGNAIASGLHVVVVTTEPFAALARSSIAARDVVVLPEVDTAGVDRLGMGYSIAAGVRAASASTGWLILPGDMPLVRPQTLCSVARFLAQHPVVYAQRNGMRGHPVGFAAELYSELAALHGDEGARRLVARYPAHGVELDDPGILADIDTPVDLEAARRSVTVPS